MAESLNYEQFAMYVVQKWQAKIQALGIIDTRGLIDSFAHEVRMNSAGNAEKMIFTFKWYGRMVDMGVGKGITINDAGFGSRKAKRWFTPTLFAEVGKLSKLMAEDIEFRINKTIAEAFVA